MDLITGGAYQGKRTYAMKHFSVSEEDIFCCSEDAPCDFTAGCIDHLENYVLYCVKNHLEPAMDFRSDAVLIGRDISCGVVPTDPLIRRYREVYGRYLQTLAARCDSVTRMFCGLPQKLK
ncbi:MAG: bifunctional adenosylcobinamide kinase/adenosylcobinamide-phosphate guanylyltransferase [Firmicutes bacterium]|nr:bifunctional adenosylcobinamide kinase/adenosylcobinamide-phosphate guanylyltransferase [Bacillota bacterium]